MREIIEFLISHRANLHEKDRLGNAPIMLACSNNSDAAELLLSKGANIHEILIMYS